MQSFSLFSILLLAAIIFLSYKAAPRERGGAGSFAKSATSSDGSISRPA